MDGRVQQQQLDRIQIEYIFIYILMCKYIYIGLLLLLLHAIPLFACLHMSYECMQVLCAPEFRLGNAGKDEGERP